MINLILRNKTEEAVSSCLEQKKLVEALVLALDGSDDVKQQVKNAYFKKNKENNLSRVIYNASTKNVTDLVAHANVENWKEVAVGISSFTTDSSEYNSKMSELGDRILKPKMAKEMMLLFVIWQVGLWIKFQISGCKNCLIMSLNY